MSESPKTPTPGRKRVHQDGHDIEPPALEGNSNRAVLLAKGLFASKMQMGTLAVVTTPTEIALWSTAGSAYCLMETSSDLSPV